MPYKFPERYPRTNDLVDYEQINKDFAEIAETLGGNVGEHNFAEDADGYDLDASTLYTINYNDQVSAIGIELNGGTPEHDKPPEDISTDYDGNEVQLPNTGAWKIIESVTFTTTDMEVVQVFAHSAYCWTGWNSSGTHDHGHSDNWIHPDTGFIASGNEPWEVPKFHMAIRINGAIMNVSGNPKTFHQPHLPMIALPENQPLTSSGTYNDSSWPGIIDIRSAVTSSPGAGMGAVFLNELESVPSGTVTIELVGRRLAGLHTSKFAENDIVAATSRSLFVVRYRSKVSRARVASSFDFAPIGKGDTSSQTQLNTNLLQRVKTQVDALGANDVAKINRYHLPSPFPKNASDALLAATDGVEYSTAITIENWCPGEHTNTFATLGILTGLTGWTQLYSGSEFLVTPSAGTLPTNTEYGYILITGTIHIQSIDKKGSTINTNCDEENHMALVGIYHKNGSTYTLLNNSVVPVSRRSSPQPHANNVTEIVSTKIDGEQRVPLMAIMDLSSTLRAGTLDGFGICVSAANYVNGNDVQVKVKAASLSFEYYRK